MPLKNLRFILFACQSFSITTCGSLKYDPPQSKKLFSPPDTASKNTPKQGVWGDKFTLQIFSIIYLKRKGFFLGLRIGFF